MQEGDDLNRDIQTTTNTIGEVEAALAAKKQECAALAAEAPQVQKDIDEANAYFKADLKAYETWMVEHGFDPSANWDVPTAEQIEERTRRARDLLRDIARAQTCPLCRAPFPKTEGECAALCQRHVDRNAAWAQHSMAVRYEEGRAVPRDYARAVELFGLAAAQGYALSQFALGQIYVHGRYGIAMDVREGLRLLEAAVAQDDAKAMWVLATVYRDGKPGVPTDLPLAVRLIRQSAELGLDSAQSELGYMCEHGWGVAESLPEALRWYKAAAEQGNATAQLSMGGCLMRVSQERFGRADATGHSVVPQALRWARMAAAQGCSEANRFIEQLESQFRRQCHNCGKQPGKGCCVLSVCVRCRSVWYCGKDCQRAHWRAGHKRDCVKSSSSNDHQPHHNDNDKE